MTTYDALLTTYYLRLLTTYYLRLHTTNYLRLLTTHYLRLLTTDYLRRTTYGTLLTAGHTLPSHASYVLTDALRAAREERRAVGAFNVYNIEGALAVRRAVDKLGLPAILQLHPASMGFGGR